MAHTLKFINLPIKTFRVFLSNAVYCLLLSYFLVFWQIFEVVQGLCGHPVDSPTCWKIGLEECKINNKTLSTEAHTYSGKEGICLKTKPTKVRPLHGEACGNWTLCFKI